MPLQLNFLLNKRLLAILLLGFTSGLPLALTGATLQAWFTEEGMSLATIGLVTLFGLPYILKFLWSPIMDRYAFLRFGKRKGWILASQLACLIMIFLLGQLQPAQELNLVIICAFLIAFFSASQDIAITAYQVDILQESERGLGAAYYVFTYRVALLISGGLALVLAGIWGWKLTYELMAIMMLMGTLLTCLLPKVNECTPVPGGLYATVYASVKDILTRPDIGLIVAFIILYKLGDALALSLFISFLLKGLGFTLVEVGLVYKIVSFVAMVAGGFVGGVCLTRLPILKALLLFGFLQGLSNLSFALLAFVGKSFSLMAISVFIENFCSGLSTAALFAFLMSLCNHRFSASQFAFLSTLASLGRVLVGPVASYLVVQLGWQNFFILSFLLTLPSLFLVLLLKQKAHGDERLSTN